MGSRFCISVPVGAWHDFLPANLESLARQNADVKAALLDASGDPRVAALAERYPQIISYRRHGPDKGQSDAILEGWKNVDGDILGWLNADDILMPGALEAARKRFEEDAALGMVCGHSVILDEEARMTGYHFAVAPPGENILEGNTISQPSCFFRRAAYDRAGGLDQSLHYVMDWDLWIRLHKSGAKAAFIDAPLSQVMWGEATKTASFNARRRAELKRLIETHAPPEKRRAIFRAFAIHTLTERLWPPALNRAVLNFLRRDAQGIYGLGADGRIHDGARLFLAHYQSAPKSGVTIAVEGDAGALDVRCDGGPVSVTRREGALDVDFAEPAGAGKTIVATLSVAPGARLRFRHCAWR